jgi:hypothetical protein
MTVSLSVLPCAAVLVGYEEDEAESSFSFA